MKPRIEYSAVNTKKPDAVEAKTLEHLREIRAQINQLINEQGIRKSDLAERMGISKSHLSNILNSQTNLTLETLARFELALGVDFKITLSKDSGGSHNEL